LNVRNGPKADAQPNVRNGWKADIAAVLKVSEKAGVWGGKFLAAVAACMLLGCVSTSGRGLAQPSSRETTVVRFRNPYIVCAGVCPDYKITVQQSGEIQTVVHPSGSRFNRGEIWSFRVNQRQLRAFRNILNGIRPRGMRRLDETCSPGRLPDGSPDPLDDPRPDDVEVRWIGPLGSDKLSSCAYTHPSVRMTINRAVTALGISVPLGVPARFIFRR
jgi:hypothetical protein